MSNKYNDPNGLPGALGLRQSGATALSNFFQFWCYVTPILGAVVADQYLGKYTTIKYFSLIYMVGIFVLFITSLPYSIEHGGAFPGLIAAMFIIGIGTGGIKSNVSPLIAEQVRSTKPFVRLLSNGQKVIVDPEVTVQRIYMIFYMCINLGSISAIATTTLELKVGFWSAYLLPFLMFCVGFFVLVSGKERYVIKPPQGGVIGHCFKALWIAARNRFDLDKAKPSLQRLGMQKYKITWDDRFVDELRTALVACKMFLFFPIYWVTYSQMMNNFISQGTFPSPPLSPLPNRTPSRPNGTPRPPKRHSPQHRPHRNNPPHPSLRPPNLPLHPGNPPSCLHTHNAHNMGFLHCLPRHGLRCRSAVENLLHGTLLHLSLQLPGWEIRPR